MSWKSPLAYLGVRPASPVNFEYHKRPPTTKDRHNVNIGDIWLDTSTNNPPTNDDIYMLVSLANGVAEWVDFGGGDLETLTGDTGGAVGPLLGNIDLVGEVATGFTVTGNPGTYTLTVTTANTENILQSLSDDGGTPVFPDANQNIDILGTAGNIVTTGTPGTNTVTIDVGGSVATSYVADDANSAIPAAGVLNVLGEVGSVLNTSAVPNLGNNLYVNMTNGANGEVLIGGAATAAWASITSSSITITPGPNTLNLEYASPAAESAFSAYLSVTQPNVTGNGATYTIIFDTELFDVGNHYDNTTGLFTAPFDGYYIFSAIYSSIVPVGASTQSTIKIRNLTTGIQHQGDSFPTRNRCTGFYGYNNAISLWAQIFVPAASGDQLYVEAQISGGAQTCSVEGGAAPIVTYFSGYLVYKL